MRFALSDEQEALKRGQGTARVLEEAGESFKMQILRGEENDDEVLSIDKIQAEVVKIYADPATADKLEKSGINAVSSTPEEFDAFFRKEAVRWEKTFKESGIKLD